MKKLMKYKKFENKFENKFSIENEIEDILVDISDDLYLIDINESNNKISISIQFNWDIIDIDDKLSLGFEINITNYFDSISHLVKYMEYNNFKTGNITFIQDDDYEDLYYEIYYISCPCSTCLSNMYESIDEIYKNKEYNIVEIVLRFNK